MNRAIAQLLGLVLLAGCENRDRLTDEQAAAEAAQGTNELIVPPSGGELPAGSPTQIGDVLYKALGTEPGWSLIIRQGAMLYQGNYGAIRIVEASPPAFSQRAGTIRSGRLTVSIAPGPCSDGMSDHVWRDKVAVSVAGAGTVRGCGGGMVAVEDPNAIEGTRFRVSAINGAPIRVRGNWWLSFANGQVSGQFGCNVFSGGYNRNGDHLSLTAGGLSQNLMGCPATEAWDKAGQRILGSNPRIEKAGGVVRLVSEAGVIELSPPQQEVPTT